MLPLHSSQKQPVSRTLQRGMIALAMFAADQFASVPRPIQRLPAAMASLAASRRGLLLVVLLFISIVASHLDVIPYWDAKAYLYCVEEAVHEPFDVLNFRCAGHPSIVYALLWGFTQYLRPWNPALMYATNALLGVASIAAFDALLRLLFPNRPGAEYTLVTALYALAPLFVAHAIFLNLDYGATAFFVLFLRFLIARRFWPASAFAVAAMFSKETGAAACAVAMLAYIVAFIFGPRTSWARRIATLRSHTPLVTVPLALVTYLAWVQVFHHDPRGWVNTYAPVQIIPDQRQAILNTNLADPGIRSFLTDIFVLNYQWLYTGVIVVAACFALIRIERPDDEPQGPPRRGVFLALALVGLVYVVTRFGFTNAARYVLLALPMVILTFYHALLSLPASHRSRPSYLTVCAVLVFLSNFRTLDFVSKSIFGTLPFGSHALLDMPSLTGGLKLDSLVYNLEFLQLQYLWSDMIRDIRPQPGNILLMGNAIYNFPPEVDGRSYALTANPSRAVPLFVAIGDVKRDVLESHVRRDGELFFYVAFPNADNVQLQNLLKEYALVGAKKYERDGYTMDVYIFRFTFTK
jgi:hypothetical protein